MSDLSSVYDRQEVVSLQPLGTDRHVTGQPGLPGAVPGGCEAVTARLPKVSGGFTDLQHRQRRMVRCAKRAARKWQREDKEWENAMFRGELDRIEAEEQRLIAEESHGADQASVGMLGSGNSKGDGPACFVCGKTHFPYCKREKTEEGICRGCGKRHYPYCKKNSKPGSAKVLEMELIDAIAREDGKGDVAVDVEKLDTEIAELKTLLSEAKAELQLTEKRGDMLPTEVIQNMRYVVSRGDWEWKTRVGLMLIACFLFVVSWAVWSVKFFPVLYYSRLYSGGVLISEGTFWAPLPPVWASYPLLGALTVVLMIARLGPFQRRPEIYSYAGPYVHDSVDRRADVMALGEVKHKARYCWFEFRKGKEVNKFLVSSELLAQLLAPTNVDASYDSRIVWERMNRSARSLHSVSIDRWLSVSQQHVVPNTVRVAYAAYQSLFRAQAGAPALGKYLPFRLGPAS